MSGGNPEGVAFSMDPSIIELREKHRHSEKVVQPDTSSNNSKDNGPKQHAMENVLLAGGIGGAIGDSVIYPLDMVKTRQQGAPNVLKYKTMSKASWTILREEGLRKGVYGGYTPAILGAFPATMLFFGTYETTKRIFINQWGVPETLTHLTAGFLGDFISSIIYVPSEVLKTRMQLQGKYNNPHFDSGYNYKGMTHATKTIIRTEGSGALFYGYKATLIRDLPFSALQFAFYEKFHQWAQEFVGKNNDMGIGLELGTGALAGGLSGVITTPLDVVKTRIQTQHHDGSASRSQPATLSNSTIGALRTVYKLEGPAGVFSGVGPRLFWTSIQSSIMLLIYQSTLKFLEDHPVF